MNQTKQANTIRAESVHAGAIARTFVRLLAIAAALFTLGALSASTASAQPASPPATSSLIVKLVGGLSVDEQAAVIERNGGTEKSQVPALRLHVIELPTDQLEVTLNSYRADPQVVRAEVNKARKSEAVPSDPLYSQQWSLPKISWDLVFGNASPSASVIVAVLDTGIDATHPDLAGGVVPGTSVLDGSNGMSDPSGHGTRVAGIVAARTSTTTPEGIAGIAYAGVQLMPVTVLNAQGLGQDSDVIAGVIWAADHDADVILMAFSNPDYSESLQEAIDYAWSKDAILVAAVGNDGVSAPSFPAGDRGVIGVAATDSDDQLASFSNSGPAVFLAAPGTNILTTDLAGTYSSMTGTSSSAAIVAGAAAQLWALDPTLTNGIIVGRLARSADPAGTQDQTGNGRINLARALLDTGTEFIQPAGAAPVGSGGPFVGPYRAAATHLQNISVIGAQTPTPVIAGNSATYGTVATNSVRVDFNGNGTCIVTLTVSGLPAGAAATFSPPTLTGTGSNPPKFALLTITTNGSTPAGTTTITVRATGTGGGGNDCATNETDFATVSFVVSAPAVAATTLSAQPASGTYGGTTTLSATLKKSSDNSVVSGKSITFTLNGNSVGSATTNGSGVATLSGVSLAAINAGTFATGVGANFAGDSGFAASSGTAQLTVNQASSTTTVSCPASVPYTGTAQTPCTATVTGAGLSLTPTPTHSNNTNAGTASASYSYAGDANHTGSSDSKTFTITQASSTTTVSCPASVPYTGSTQTPCTATVTGAGGLSLAPTPTYSNNTNAGTASASYSYAGDANHTGSSDSKTFTIDKINTSTTAASNPNPSTADASVTFTATVAPATAAGTVQFKVDGNSFGAAVPVVGGVATLPTSALTVAKTYTVDATYNPDANHNGSSGNLAGGQVVTAGAPAQLAFDVQPTDTPAGQAIAPAVTVRILDASGNQTTSTADVTVATGDPDAFTAGSTTTVAAVNGVATFANLRINTAGTYAIGAASTNLATATSNSFNVTAGTAVTFAFGVPASIPAGQSFDITVTAKDQFNNTATGYTGVVHFTSSDPQATLTPDTTFAGADVGVRTISGGTILKTSGNQTITATDTAATNPSIAGTSASILINPGDATVLVVTAPSAIETAGVPFAVTVKAQDGYGNPAAGYVGPIHFTSTDLQADLPADYTFVPGTDQGTQTFSVTLHSAGQWTVTATEVSSPSFSGVSGTITVQAGAAAKLAFKIQPANTVVGAAIPDFTVEVQDADGNPVTTSSAAITIALGNNPNGAVLSGTATVSAINGVATFSGLTLDKAAMGYTLVASSDGLAVATSNAFDVGKGTATLSLSNLHQPYDGSPKSATVTTTPSGLSGVTVTYDGGNAATNAGSYAVVASLNNPDYQAPNATETLVIDKSSSMTAVSCPASVTFNGSTQIPCSATVTGAGGLSQSLTVSYTSNTNVGTATASASYAGDANHTSSSDSKNFTIDKASSATVVSCPASVTFNGSAQTPCTATVTGAGGLNQSLMVSYTNNTYVGTATASASFAGDANHTGSSDSKTFTIDPVTVASQSPVKVFVGLRNSDDILTAFDIRVELRKIVNAGNPGNPVVVAVASGLSRCVRGLVRAPADAREVSVPFDSFSPIAVNPGEALELVVLTRVGTNPDGTRCTGTGAGHSNATGLRLYYDRLSNDATTRHSRWGATITPNSAADLYLRSDGNACPGGGGQSTAVTTRFLSGTAPGATNAKCKDSAGVNFAGGNLYQVVGTWSVTAP